MRDSVTTGMQPEIRRQLDQLRKVIRLYVFFEGCAVVLAVCGGWFWGTMLLDTLHFSLRKLELPGWLRLGFLAGAIAVLAAIVCVMLGLRLLRGFRAKALALVLERRFPQLGDRLITAVELAESPQSELGGAMLQRTIADAVREIESTKISDVFNPGPLVRWAATAAALFVSIGVFGVINAQAMERWFNAFVLLRPDYWEPFRKNALQVRVVVQPGDRLREFDENGEFKHPRGGDLTILAEAPEGREMPSEVLLSYRPLGGNSGSGKIGMSQSSDRSFRHTLTRVIDDHELWVIGGDFVNRRPYRVVIVEPPNIDQIVLDCNYPDYTGMNAGNSERVVQGTQVSLPMETEFRFIGTANKPLVGVQIRCRHFDLEFGRSSRAAAPRLTVHSADGSASQVIELAESFGSELFSPDGRTFAIPLQLATNAGDALAAAGAALPAIPLPADTQLQIYLEDEDDVYSPDPTLLTINGTVDQDPVVETSRTGVGGQVTRMAEIPIAGRLTDDYGLANAWFGYRIDDAADFVVRKFENAPSGDQKDFVLGGVEEKTERFNVLPLQLNVEQRLALTVFAQDGDDINGPHVSHGEVYNFTIVTPEDLLAQLYDKELNLRQRFEQIRREVAEVRDDLVAHQERYEAYLDLGDSPPSAAERPDWEAQRQQILAAVASTAERSLHVIRKTHTESRSVEYGFGEIRAEMVNNRVDTPTALDRIDAGILTPLHEINENDYPGIDEQLGLYRLANELGNDPRPAMDDAAFAINAMLARMDQVLRKMEERKGFNEMIQLLQDILGRERELYDETKAEQQRRLFDLLK